MTNKRLSILLTVAACTGQSPVGAQVLEYIDCQVRDPASFVAASEQFMSAMEGGVRPSVSIDLNLWNGASAATHTVIVVYENHQAVETFLNRIDDAQAAYMQLLNSLGNVATCENEGLAVQLDAWGDLEAAWEYYAVYPVTTTDAGRYAAALADYAESVIDDAPGAIILYQNRAGEANATHFVVFLSPSLAGLNEFLDGLLTSEAYADFTEEVASIRTLGSATQARRIVTFEP